MIRIDFKLIKQPNRWSCTACAFAMACGVRLEEFIENIGHDGSEIMFPHLPEPKCRKGFPFPDCIRVCLRWGLTVTPIDFKPLCGPDPEHTYTIEQDEFVQDMLQKYQGVIQGRGRLNYHTVGWDGKKIYDPSIGIYTFETSRITPEMFWIIK